MLWLRHAMKYKANLLHDEVRILIFDRMTENQKSQRQETGSPSQVPWAPYLVLSTC